MKLVCMGGLVIEAGGIRKNSRLLLKNLMAPTTVPPLIPSNKLCLEQGIAPRFEMSFLRSICYISSKEYIKRRVGEKRHH